MVLFVRRRQHLAFIDVIDLQGFGDDFGPNIRSEQSTPVFFEASIDFEFEFGIGPDGEFFVRNPALAANLSLDHDDTFDLSLLLGPVGIGIEDGILRMDTSVRVGAQGELSINTISGDVDGDLIGTPKLGAETSLEVFLPVVLQGALSGLTENGQIAVIEASFNNQGQTGLVDENGKLSDFFKSITLNTGGLSELLAFSELSLDELLAGLDAALGVLIDENGLAFTKLPLIDRSLAEIFGGDVDFLTALREGINFVQESLSDIQGLERDLNFELNERLRLGVPLGDRAAAVPEAADWYLLETHLSWFFPYREMDGEMRLVGEICHVDGVGATVSPIAPEDVLTMEEAIAEFAGT